MSYIDVTSLTQAKDVFSYGPRLAIALQVFEALRELGLLDPKHRLSRYLHPERHSSPSPSPPPPPPKRIVEPQQLTKPTKPPARRTNNSMQTTLG
ncbi:hypothetical protein JCM3765_002981 [Sporobolomyces pararoseus]